MRPSRPPHAWLTALLIALLPAAGAGQEVSPVQIAPEEPELFDRIVVGVRKDAAPFSYRVSGEPSPSLDDYGGYMVAICREALELVVSEHPFRGARVIAKEVAANDRFKLLSGDGDVDVLCGPTSITDDRLNRFYVSMPLYLSGAAVAEQSAGSGRWPPSYYCGSIVGYLGNTTSEFPALAEFAERGRFGRYSPAVAFILNKARSEKEAGYDQEVLRSFKGQSFGEEQAFQATCLEKLTAPPVVEYDSHDQGLSDLCEGRILFYVADVDIISTYLHARPECPIDLNRSVLAIEQYAAFFRSIEEPEPPFRSPRALKNQYLYSKFNMALHRLSRQGEGIFIRAFRKAFGDRKRTEILDHFFRMYSYGLR